MKIMDAITYPGANLNLFSLVKEAPGVSALYDAPGSVIDTSSLTAPLTTWNGIIAYIHQNLAGLLGFNASIIPM